MRRWTPRKVLLATTALVPLGIVAATANPLGPNVVGGGASVSGVGTSNVIVNQTTPRAIINWNSFNIGAGETTRFVQPNASSIALNRVTGGLGPSQLYGNLTANGQVYLINPDGVMIGGGATINTGGFLASTHDISNANFMAGKYLFNIPGKPSASIVNEGVINSHSQGFAALVAPGVRNSGTITANYGKVALASSGDGYSLDFYGDKLITLAIGDSIAATVKDVATGQPLNTLVKNTGKLSANGGRVELTAAQARAVVDSVINNTGVIEARSVGQKNGKIVLGGPTASTKVASLPKQTVKVSGKLDVSNTSGKGGKIQVTGEKIVVKAASFDASGTTGGGKVLIGGDTGGGHGHWAVALIPQAKLEAKAVPNATTVTIDPATTINVSATSVGDGGKAIVWADGDTAFAGTILARGGAGGGNGGFVEVSGKQVLNYMGIADLRAPAGSSGTLLLDPYDVTINGGDANGSFDANGFWTPSGSGSTISVGTLLSQLGMGNVIITTNGGGTEPGDITILSNITYNGSNSLTLRAHNDIFFDDAVVTFGGAGSLILRADSDGNGAGVVGFTAPALLDFSIGTGKISLFYNPINFTTPTDFSSNLSLNNSVNGQFTAFMLVSFANLADIGTNTNTLGGTYALGRDIGGPFTGISGTFTGVFDGLDRTLSGTLTGPAIFGTNAGTIRNLKLQNVILAGNAPRVGILAGTNAGLIEYVTATGGSVSNAQVGGSTGGLVGWNIGTIKNSSSSASVTSAALGASLGGLVGTNNIGGLIEDSTASGNVSSTANVPPSDCGNSSSSSCVYAGGLVGRNVSTTPNFTSEDYADVFNTVFLTGIQSSHATGNVSVGSNGVGGGLVGYNAGIILDSSATVGTVTGLAGVPSDPGDQFSSATILGGLAGINQGLIVSSDSNRNVGSMGVNYLRAGGLVGDSVGIIVGGTANGTVKTGDYSEAGGFVGAGGSDDCPTCSIIAGGTANSAVTVGSYSIAGGFAATSGFIIAGEANGAVIGGGNSVLGGFVGAHNIGNYIWSSTTSNAVTANGSNVWAGGFVGYNGGTIYDSQVVGGQLTATSQSIVGGFAAVNIGLIGQVAQVSSTSSQTMTVQNDNVVGAFVGANFGTLDGVDVVAADVTIGSNNVFGTVVGANAQFTRFNNNFVPPSILLSSFPAGTFVNFQTSGNLNETGTGNTPGLPHVGQQFPTSLPTYPSILVNCVDTMCQIFKDGVLGGGSQSGGDHPQVPNQVVAPPINQIPSPPIERPATDALIKLAALTQNLPAVNPAGTPIARTFQNTPGTQPRSLAPVLPQRPTCGAGGQCTSFATLLPPGRFIPDQVVVQIPQGASQQNVQQILASMGLMVLGSQPLGNGNNALNLRLPAGVAIGDVIRRLEQNQVVAIAQANMKYTVVQQAPAAVAPFTASRGDPAQYSMGKLHLNDAHRVASGNNIIVAVIDSEVDGDHAELKGTISQRYDATESEARAHSHGTAMAGAIVSRDRLLGVAPGAKILAIRAFSETQTSAESTTFNILKGIEHAIAQGARVINMSFAGPYDPTLEKALKDAAAKGVILIGASGNAGPKSPPLWPGADPNVIAVTATDSGDKVFRQANRGPYISVASPGVEILAPAPQAGYQMSTGTSIATAHVSGVVALMLERDPTLTPADVRLILESTAADLGPKGRDLQFGWGLVNPARALSMVDERKRQKGATSAPQPVQR